MAGEYTLQNIPRAGANLSLIYGANEAFGMGADEVPINNTDEGTRQFRLQFQNPENQKVPSKMQDVASDNQISKTLELSGDMNKYYFDLT